MNVSVRLYAELARQLAGGQRQITRELPAGSSVSDLLDVLAVPAELGVIVGRNGKLAARSEPLLEGDKIELMTAMEGGARSEQGGPPAASPAGFPLPHA